MATPPHDKQPSLDHFREKLLQQQAQLESSLQSTVKEGREISPDDLQDSADHAVQSYQKELIFLQGTKGHAQMGQVRAALERIEDGSFGECQHCGKRIGAKRLEALPWTPHCIECQEKVERGEIDDPAQAA